MKDEKRRQETRETGDKGDKGDNHLYFRLGTSDFSLSL
jgi:hypothetical protein